MNSTRKKRRLNPTVNSENEEEVIYHVNLFFETMPDFWIERILSLFQSPLRLLWKRYYETYEACRCQWLGYRYVCQLFLRGQTERKTFKECPIPRDQSYHFSIVWGSLDRWRGAPVDWRPWKIWLWKLAWYCRAFGNR